MTTVDTVAVVAKYLHESASHGLSRWTMIHVLRQWHAEGTSKADMVAAVRLAGSQAAENTRDLFAEYHDAIVLLIPEPDPGRQQIHLR